ncbi:MAG: peptide deformylase [Deltaproteobacteria bacterium]|jgi:peptide deformylase|nr:peptide deformylase [Deltaproteobacteria bacterium]
MAVLPILKYPDPKLRQVAKEVTVFDNQLAILAKNMLETMISAQGVGIAAPQVGESLSMFLVNFGSSKEVLPEEVVVFVNPKVLEHSGTIDSEEGCLSVEGLRANVTRAQRLKIMAQDLDGQPFTYEFEDHDSIVIQHELDHLTGKLFIDHLSFLKREMYDKSLKQARKKKEKEEKKAASQKTFEEMNERSPATESQLVDNLDQGAQSGPPDSDSGEPAI